MCRRGLRGKSGARHRRRAGHRPRHRARRSPAWAGRSPLPTCAAPADFFFVRTDVSREAAARACVRAVVKRFGRLDALVNNAGIADPDTGPVEKLELREWNRRIGTNLTGAVPDGEARGAAPAPRARRDRQHRLHARAAVRARHRGLRGEQGRRWSRSPTRSPMSLGPEVRVNCVSPGWIAHQPVRRKDHAQHPVGRVGRDQDIAELRRLSAVGRRRLRHRRRISSSTAA